MIGILPIAADPIAPRWNHCRVDAQDYKSELHHLEDLQINDICSWINLFHLTYRLPVSPWFRFRFRSRFS